MRLCIRAGSISIDVPDITLENGCEPSICGYQHPTGDFEPAVWFKVMVLDALSIDCDDRRLSWIPLSTTVEKNFAAQYSSIPSCGEHRLSEEQLPAGSRCADDAVYCRLDEAFEILPNLAAQYKSEAIKRDDLYDHLARLLHVHVLPSIRLTKQDAECIKAFIAAQEAVIRQIDEKILAETEKRDSVQQSKTNLRKKFLQGLAEADGKSSATLFPHRFTEALLIDVEKDISEAWLAVEQAQSAVERAKETTTAQEAALKAERTTRDAVTAEYEQLLSLREKLKEVSRNRSKLRNKFKGALSSTPPDPLHDMYLGLGSKLSDFSRTIQLLADKKLLALSVKEAARNALDDLNSGEDTLGIEIDCIGAARATDVLGTTVSAQWRSLSEQIASILADGKNCIAQKHWDFCQHVAARCSAAISEKQLYDSCSRKIIGEDGLTDSGLPHSSTISKDTEEMTYSTSTIADSKSGNLSDNGNNEQVMPVPHFGVTRRNCHVCPFSDRSVH